MEKVLKLCIWVFAAAMFLFGFLHYQGEIGELLHSSLFIFFGVLTLTCAIMRQSIRFKNDVHKMKKLQYAKIALAIAGIINIILFYFAFRSGAYSF